MPHRFPLLFALILTLPSHVLAEPPEPRQLLEQSENAIRALHGVCYEATVEADGILAARIPKMAGQVMLDTAPGGDLPRLTFDGQFTLPRQTTMARVRAACDGKQFSLADYGQKMFVSQTMPGAMSLLNNIGPLILKEFSSAKPFERELRAVSLEYIGTEKVGAAECDVIHATLAAEGGEVRWYLSRADHLPRRVQRFIDSPVGKTSITTSLNTLDSHPPLSDELFRLEKPEGFTAAATPPAPGAPGESKFLAAGSEAPDWTLKSPDGKDVSLKSLRGKIVFLDFWATWCMPCKMAMPGVQKLHEKYKDKPVVVIGMNCWERGADPAAFMRDKKYTYPLLLKADEAAPKYHVTGIPTFYVIDPEGKILLAFSGAGEDKLQQADKLIEQTLAKMSATPATGS